MTDKELLDSLETRVTYAMLKGCEMDDYLGDEEYCPESWAVTLRADELCALIDMARGNT
jgi:hypothetical protein